MALVVLEDRARYAGILLALTKGFDLRSKVVLPFGQKKLDLLFWPILRRFWSPLGKASIKNPSSFYY